MNDLKAIAGVPVCTGSQGGLMGARGSFSGKSLAAMPTFRHNCQNRTRKHAQHQPNIGNQNHERYQVCNIMARLYAASKEPALKISRDATAYFISASWLNDSAARVNSMIFGGTIQFPRIAQFHCHRTFQDWVRTYLRRFLACRGCDAFPQAEYS